jgi:hypothetical protein
LNGVSFAVAAMSGFLAAALSREPERSTDPIALLSGLDICQMESSARTV